MGCPFTAVLVEDFRSVFGGDSGRESFLLDIDGVLTQLISDWDA
jgi:hypothetical protein